MALSRYLSVGVFFIVLSFQNCGQHNFSSRIGVDTLKSFENPSSADGDLSISGQDGGGSPDSTVSDLSDTPVLTALGEDPKTVGNSNNSSNSNGASSGASNGNGQNQGQSQAQNPSQSENDNDDADSAEDSMADSEDDMVRDDDDLSFICILDGKGKSIHVGLVEGQLDEVGSTQKTICMSKSACLNLVGKKYSVEGPAFRGYCKNLPDQIKSLSNKAISDLLAGI